MSSAKSVISFVVVTFQSERTIRETLRSIVRFSDGAQVVIVDNGSQDATLQIVSTFTSELDIVVVSGQGNVGFGVGVNLGVRETVGDLVLILNPDATITSLDVPEIKLLATRPRVGIQGGVIDSNTTAPGRVDVMWGWRRELLWGLLTWFIVPREISVRRPQVRTSRSKSWVSGSAVIVRRDEFHRLGGFSPHLFLYYEDQEICARAQKAGFPVERTACVTVSHVGQASSTADHDWTIATALTSLIEFAALQGDDRDGRKAAAAVIRGLRAMRAFAAVASFIPIISRRARDKRRSVARVLTHIARAAENPPTPLVNPNAAPALLAAIENRMRPFARPSSGGPRPKTDTRRHRPDGTHDANN